MKVKIWSAEKSAHNIRKDAVTLGRATNAVWSNAQNASVLLKKPKTVGSGKSKKRATMVRGGVEVPIPVKLNRCIRKTAIKALLSSAALSASRLLAREAGKVRQTALGESTVAAALPILSKGAELCLEQALVAYALLSEPVHPSLTQFGI